jgi:hypothetical protein
MSGLVNDAFRFVIARTIVLLGVWLDLWQRFRIVRFTANQRRLKQKYRLNDDTPVVSYGPRVVESIRHAAAHAGRDAGFATTSGSTGEPKRILYTKRRVGTLKFTFSDMFMRAVRAYGLKRTGLYVFSSFSRDATLTSLLLNEPRLPPYLSTLQAPYRLQQHDAIRALAAQYGASAVRLWLLTIANPGVLYATNPSTISSFFDELQTNWTGCSALVRDWHDRRHQFPPALRKLVRRITSRGSTRRLRVVATSETSVAITHFAPAVRAYICWTGGYVKPFLDRLANHLQPDRYRLIPMYSMSTETVETETVFRNGDAQFLPLAPGVVYEFIPANAGDGPENLLTPAQLKSGETYAMVVSDAYGLRRYQTGDLFECRRQIKGLPDLIFLRRRGLEYSFIGEKVTAEQLNVVFRHMRAQFSETIGDAFLTCVPSLPPHESPQYKFVLIRDSNSGLNAHLLASHCDKLLSQLNCEYHNKRRSGSLAPPTFIQSTPGAFAERFAGTWETQFKFLPLYCRTWESVYVPHLNATYPRVSHKNTAQLTQTTSSH